MVKDEYQSRISHELQPALIRVGFAWLPKREMLSGVKRQWAVVKGGIVGVDKPEMWLERRIVVHGEKELTCEFRRNEL